MAVVEICILLLHAATTMSMVGLIWFVQVVHYPLFARVGRSEFAAYEQAHQSLTTWIVAPLMLIEVITAAMLVWLSPEGISGWLVWAGIALVGLLWLTTYLVQVPQHARLAVAYDVDVQRQLVKSNWYRTAAWSARGVIVLCMLGQMFANNSVL